ncbi:unnamed protein product, partial [Effrenium voratum]
MSIFRSVEGVKRPLPLPSVVQRAPSPPSAPAALGTGLRVHPPTRTSPVQVVSPVPTMPIPKVPAAWHCEANASRPVRRASEAGRTHRSLSPGGGHDKGNKPTTWFPVSRQVPLRKSTFPRRIRGHGLNSHIPADLCARPSQLFWSRKDRDSSE